MAVDPWTIVAGVQAIGGVMNWLGGETEAKAKKESARINAAYYNKQAERAQLEGDRTLGIYERESEFVIGAKQSALGRAGVNFTGSMVAGMAFDEATRRSEMEAIVSNTKLDVELLRMKAQDSSNTAQAIIDTKNSRFVSSLLGTGANVLQTKAILDK